MKATVESGALKDLDKCYINIQGYGNIYMQTLPDISDQKSANYTDENAIGRSMPFKTYQNSDNRTVSWTCHFVVCQQSDISRFWDYIKAFQSAVYPRTAGKAPWEPPPICKLKCGDLLSKQELCAIMKSYSLKYDTSVVWDEETYLPYKFDVDLSFDVVYNQSDLPGAERILSLGY